MPALPLSATQLAEAAKLKSLFKEWQATRKENGLPSSQESACEDLGFGQSALAQYLNGKIPLNVTAAVKFSKLLGRGIEDFSPTLAEQAGKVAEAVALPIPEAISVVIAEQDNPAFYHIPKVKLQLRAGVTGFQTVPEIYDGSTISVQKNWVDRKGYRPGALIAVTVKGDSMEPNLYDGDIVIINTDDKKMVDGTVYAFNYEGEAVIKRLGRQRGSWWLFSDNQDQGRHRPRGCTEGECIIVGRVVKRETERI